ncbi:hypothetical protein [Acinetobacter sp. Marseille-Q1618]|uniref:hypothetical protein n=1 Tax=Acinetobacter sp. Marseille-Q1618 TaxID=2697502 RepID=UPI00156ECDD4|nr:hypothetical protein [Acinetobacter sp. Marseille-Q1618]
MISTSIYTIDYQKYLSIEANPSKHLIHYLFIHSSAHQLVDYIFRLERNNKLELMTEQLDSLINYYQVKCSDLLPFLISNIKHAVKDGHWLDFKLIQLDQIYYLQHHPEQILTIRTIDHS